ncbi:MAG: class I SAM-dependent methyltransferase [Fischerella sp.]|nr:class I SAM-dependent methyltransferase [Fischerella sp.]
MEHVEIDLQHQYYTKTAGKYDEWHLNPEDEHYFALSFLVGVIDYLQIDSILDVGAGTGRAIAYIKQKKPNIRLVGIEPVRELREIGYQKGLTESELIDGDATAIAFGEGEFDLVCEFGVLHHIRKHHIAVSEMLRVANKAIFISDSNRFGQGSMAKRTIQLLINAIGLWGVANYLKTRGKGYLISEGDGLAYSYSVFDDYRLIRKHCKSIHILNTRDGGINPYSGASHVALLAIKK